MKNGKDRSIEIILCLLVFLILIVVVCDKKQKDNITHQTEETKNDYTTNDNIDLYKKDDDLIYYVDGTTSKDPINNVKIEKVEFVRENSMNKVRVTVVNNYNKSINYVRVNLFFTDENGDSLTNSYVNSVNTIPSEGGRQILERYVPSSIENVKGLTVRAILVEAK